MKKVSEYIVEVSEGYDRLTFTFKEIDKAASFIRTVSTHHLAVDDDKPRELKVDIRPVFEDVDEEDDF